MSSDRSAADRRRFLAAGLTGAVAATLPIASSQGAAAEVGPFELDELTIADMRDGMEAGKYSARGLVEKYLGRIEAVDRLGPKLNSVIELNPDALKIADELDRERQEGGPRGPLHGVPILLKDNIDTADKMATTAGSLALVGARPPADAFLVRRLRRAGAVFLGKTNLSEWANLRSNRSTSGWSGRGGLTRNPWALDRNTSGSSSGSAAAVAANLCAAAVGTETDGSIVSPSSVCGIVGIKPTVGLVSRTGVIPLSHTQDTAGPMARTVRDAAILLGGMVGIDDEDDATASSLGKSAADYTKTLDKDGLRGARIGVVRNFFGFHEGVDQLIEESLVGLKSLGATLIDPTPLPHQGTIGRAETIVLRYELKADLNAYLARLGPNAPVRTLADVIEFNLAHHDRELQYFGQEIFEIADALGPLTDKVYRDALETCRRLSRAEGIDAVMNEHQLDALVAPTDGPAWVTDLVIGDRGLGGSSSAAAVAGYPSITVPAGHVYGLPVGISFFARAWSEPLLLKLAYAYEQGTKFRQTPKFLPTAELGAKASSPR
ncbi:MAG: amidase [Pirellulaceae bacterium]|nr:amidase [Pirellulaceae bacterium]